MIDNCNGQVILSTHDPIMSKWMKDHLIFMDKNGRQMKKELVDIIYDISIGEVSYQESILNISKKKYIVVVEGKSDVACIEKAYNTLGMNKNFE